MERFFFLFDKCILLGKGCYYSLNRNKIETNGSVFKKLLYLFTIPKNYVVDLLLTKFVLSICLLLQKIL